VESGSDIPISKRPLMDIFSAIPIKIKANSNENYYLSIQSKHNLNTKIYLTDRQTLHEMEEDKISFLNFYSGGILFLIFYNFLILLLLKDRVYFYYCFFALSFLATSLVIAGRLDQIFILKNTTFSHYLICFSSVSLMSAILFTSRFLELEKHLKNMFNKFLFIFILSILLFASGFLPSNLDNPFIFGNGVDITIVFGLIHFIYAAIKVNKKSPYAKFYLTSWGFVFVAVLIWLLMSKKILPMNFFTQNSLPIANMGEMLILSFDLAFKIKLLNKEKATAIKNAEDKELYARLLRVLSHDVANSLTIINSYSKKMTKLQNINEQIKNDAEKIYQAGENVKALLNLVREQEVLRKKEKNLTLTLVHVLSCLKLAKTLNEPHLLDKKIDLQINVPENLSILADKTSLLNNIINNILSNAIKFSFEEGQIIVNFENSKEHNIIIFQDFGVGMDKDFIDKTFFSEKYYSTKGTKNELGSGIGTHLIREYMTLFGGKIEVDSIPIKSNDSHHGTTIKLFFPRNSLVENF
jgi:signal transduction histidine kinase